VNKHRKSIFVAGVVALAGAVGMSGGCRSQPTNPAGSSVAPIPANSFKQAWSAALKLPEGNGRDPGETVNHVYQRQDMLFVQTTNNRVYEFERESGLLRTVIPVVPPGGALRAPVAVGNRVVFPTNTTLEVYDRKGEKQKTVPFQRVLTSGGAGEGDIFFVGIEYPGAGRLLAVNLSGDYRGVLWELQTGGAVTAAPAVSNHVVYAASNDGHLYAVSADADRKAVWAGSGTFRTDGAVLGDVQADDYGVYIASTDTKLYCLDRGTSKVKWQYLAGIALTDGPVITDSTVYQLVPGQGLAAIDKISSDPNAYNRKPRWIAENAKQFLAEDEGHSYILSADNHVLALNKKTGEEEFRSKRDDFVSFASNTKDATIYASTAKGDVVAFVPVLKSGSVGQLVMRMVPVKERAQAGL
jgi:outer membrane protein assembly factor BamB